MPFTQLHNFSKKLSYVDEIRYVYPLRRFVWTRSATIRKSYNDWYSPQNGVGDSSQQYDRIAGEGLTLGGRYLVEGTHRNPVRHSGISEEGIVGG